MTHLTSTVIRSSQADGRDSCKEEAGTFPIGHHQPGTPLPPGPEGPAHGPGMAEGAGGGGETTTRLRGGDTAEEVCSGEHSPPVTVFTRRVREPPEWMDSHQQHRERNFKTRLQTKAQSGTWNETGRVPGKKPELGCGRHRAPPFTRQPQAAHCSCPADAGPSEGYDLDGGGGALA